MCVQSIYLAIMLTQFLQADKSQSTHLLTYIALNSLDLSGALACTP